MKSHEPGMSSNTHPSVQGEEPQKEGFFRRFFGMGKPAQHRDAELEESKGNLGHGSQESPQLPFAPSSALPVSVENPGNARDRNASREEEKEMWLKGRHIPDQGVKMVIFDWDATIGTPDSLVSPEAEDYLRNMLEEIKSKQGCLIGIMSYNIYGLLDKRHSIIVQELKRCEFFQHVERDMLWGYLRPIGKGGDLKDVKNVHPVFHTFKGLCDITCKVRAINRIQRATGLLPTEILYVDDSATQTGVALKNQSCNVYTVKHTPGLKKCLSEEDTKRILKFLLPGIGSPSYRGWKNGKVWQADSSGYSAFVDAIPYTGPL